MTEQEAPTGPPRPRPPCIRAVGHRQAERTPPLGLRGTQRGANPQVSRVAACALGLAYARREDADGLRELVDIAGADEDVLAAARAQIGRVDVVDHATRQRADALLYAAIGHLDRLLD